MKLPFPSFMAANTTTIPATMNFSCHSLIPAIPRRRKHRNPLSVSNALRRCGTHKKHFYSHRSPVNFSKDFQKNKLSARKLAAGLWQLQFSEVSGVVGAAFRDGSFCSSISQLAKGNSKNMFLRCHNSGEKFKETTNQPSRPVTILRTRNGLRCELESTKPRLRCCSKEEATKWNPALNESCDEIHGRKLLEDRSLVGDRDSVATVLLEEVLQAQRSMHKLKAAHKSYKRKVENFLQNLEEEKVLWKHTERRKMEAKLDDLKDKLATEKRSRETMELLNTKLLHDLVEANQSAKQFVTNYEKERKEREHMEQVCNELAMQIGEDKATFEGLQGEFAKIREEVEEEREMMQMAEQWREERVQMKLIDAKDILEQKFNQMVQLIAFLQMFLKSKGAEVDTTELEDAQLIKQAVESVNIQRILELSYDFSNIDDVFPISEELRKDYAGESEIKPGPYPSLASPSSKILIENLEEEVLNKSSTFHQPSTSETVDHVDDQYVNQDKNISESETEHSKWKASLVSKRPRPIPTISSQHRRLGNDLYKQEECNRSNSTGSIQSGKTTTSSLRKGSVEGSSRHSKLLRKGNSRDNNMNPHIARAMKGCIEWPRGIPKSNSKIIPLEERVKNQKSQLHHLLKPKAY